MITIQELEALKEPAIRSEPYPDPRWPPSIYYRYLGYLLNKIEGKVAIELGTCGGGASLTMAVMNPDAIIISIDIEKLPQVSPIEELCKNFKYVEGDSIQLAKVLGPKFAPIDLLFLDTTHEYEQTKGEFEAWLPYMKSGGVICFDDLLREGTEQFWNELPNAKVRLDEMHLGGSPTDGGFGACLCI
jgi:predicted O-methyltransferase YrrM